MSWLTKKIAESWVALIDKSQKVSYIEKVMQKCSGWDGDKDYSYDESGEYIRSPKTQCKIIPFPVKKW